MRGRSGPFWDGVEGRAPMPRAAATLGLEFVDIDADAGTIEQLNVSFLRPARPGRLIGKGRVVHRDGDLAYLEAGP